MYASQGMEPEPGNCTQNGRSSGGDVACCTGSGSPKRISESGLGNTLKLGIWRVHGKNTQSVVFYHTCGVSSHAAFVGRYPCYMRTSYHPKWELFLEEDRMKCQYCGRRPAVTSVLHRFGNNILRIQVCRRCETLLVEVPTGPTEQESDRRMEIATAYAENRIFGY